MAQKKNIPQHTHPHELAKWWWLSLGLVAVTGLTAFAATFGGRILPGVTIGSVPVGGLTMTQAKARLTSTLSQRRLTLTYSDWTWTPTMADLGVVYDFTAPLHQAFNLGRSASFQAWAQAWIWRQPVALSYTWTNDTLQAYFQNIISSIGQPPQEPMVAYRDGSWQVSAGQSGLVINDQAFQDQLRQVVANGQATTVALQPTIQWPTVTAADFQPAVTEATNMINRTLILTADDQQQTVDAAALASWLTFSVPSDHRPVVMVNQAAVGSSLLSFAKTVNKDPIPEQVIVSANKTDVVHPGQAGRAMDIQTAVDTVSAEVTNPTATSLVLPMHDVSPVQSASAVPPAPITSGKVIAVDLTKQWEYIYEDNILVYSSAISSGIHDWTPTGTFHIYAKTKKQKMSGPGYYVPNVPNILWFKGDYSLHGVYWHHDFGIRPRSHGCVGEPLDTAAWLYDWAPVGTPVVIYKSSQNAA